VSRLLKALALDAISLSCFFVPSANAEPKVRIEFLRPENYTDVSFRSMTPASAHQRLTGELSRTIEEAAAKSLGGYELDVRILDIR
jgi:hypothetical protein